MPYSLSDSSIFPAELDDALTPQAVLSVLADDVEDLTAAYHNLDFLILEPEDRTSNPETSGNIRRILMGLERLSQIVKPDETPDSRVYAFQDVGGVHWLLEGFVSVDGCLFRPISDAPVDSAAFDEVYTIIGRDAAIRLLGEFTSLGRFLSLVEIQDDPPNLSIECPSCGTSAMVRESVLETITALLCQTCDAEIQQDHWKLT